MASWISDRYQMKKMFFGLVGFLLVACGAEKPVEGTGSSTASSSSTSSSSSSSSGGGSQTDISDMLFIPDSSWTCGVPEGIPPPQLGELIFSAQLEVGERHEFGETPFGMRTLLSIVGASFQGPRLKGEFLDGGLELELTLSNGAKELEQIDVLRTDDGSFIYMRSCGFSPAGADVTRFVPDFEAPNGSAYAWINRGRYAGVKTVVKSTGAIQLDVYDVSTVPLNQTELQLEDPLGVPNQPWECAKLSATQGASVLTENVSLGGSISIGDSKRGNRNIIPITGGRFSGRLSGSVLSGGADYQLIGGQGGGAVLDARYTLKTDDNEYVLVRNCGPFGALIPLFETRKDGPYAYLNENRFLSSDPGIGGGGVSITFYEAN